MRLLCHRTEFFLNGTAGGEQIVERAELWDGGAEACEFGQGDFSGKVADQRVLRERTAAKAGQSGVETAAAGGIGRSHFRGGVVGARVEMDAELYLAL